MVVDRIFISPERGAAQLECERISVRAGLGVAGDRNYGVNRHPGQDLTLIEAEEIERFCNENGRGLDLSLTRRNLVTRGVRLNELLNVEFTIGPVRLGVCELKIDVGPGYRVYFTERKGSWLFSWQAATSRRSNRTSRPQSHWRRPAGVVMVKAVLKPKARSVPPTRTVAYDVADQLRTPEEMAAYLDAWLEEAPEDSAGIARALGDIARAKGMTQVARDAGLSRESLYKALSESGNPSFATVLKVARAVGVRLHAQAA